MEKITYEKITRSNPRDDTPSEAVWRAIFKGEAHHMHSVLQAAGFEVKHPAEVLLHIYHFAKKRFESPDKDGISSYVERNYSCVARSDSAANVKNWSAQDWSDYYFRFFAPDQILRDGVLDDLTKRLFLGPEFTDDEVLGMFSRSWSDGEDGPYNCWHIQYLDGPLFLCSWSKREDWTDIMPPVAKDLVKKFEAMDTDEAKAEYRKRRIEQSDGQSMASAVLERLRARQRNAYDATVA